MRLRDREIRVEQLEHGHIRPSDKAELPGATFSEIEIPGGKVTITVSKFTAKQGWS